MTTPFRLALKRTRFGLSLLSLVYNWPFQPPEERGLPFFALFRFCASHVAPCFKGSCRLWPMVSLLSAGVFWGGVSWCSLCELRVMWLPKARCHNLIRFPPIVNLFLTPIQHRHITHIPNILPSLLQKKLFFEKLFYSLCFSISNRQVSFWCRCKDGWICLIFPPFQSGNGCEGSLGNLFLVSEAITAVCLISSAKEAFLLGVLIYQT